MTLKIVSNGLAEKSVLKVDTEGINYFLSGLNDRKMKDIAFDEVDCVLLNEAGNELSLQVATEVYTIRVKPSSRKHQIVIDTIVGEVAKAFSKSAQRQRLINI
jgi:hypothetical protein